MARKLGLLEGNAPALLARPGPGSSWKNPRSIRYTGALMALYLHFGPFSKYVAEKIRAAIALEEPNPTKVGRLPRRPPFKGFCAGPGWP